MSQYFINVLDVAMTVTERTILESSAKLQVIPTRPQGARSEITLQIIPGEFRAKTVCWPDLDNVD